MKFSAFLYIAVHLFNWSVIKGQKLILEDEWDKFMATLREPLPSTFRITGSKRLVAFFVIRNLSYCMKYILCTAVKCKLYVKYDNYESNFVI